MAIRTVTLASEERELQLSPTEWRRRVNRTLERAAAAASGGNFDAVREIFAGLDTWEPQRAYQARQQLAELAFSAGVGDERLLDRLLPHRRRDPARRARDRASEPVLLNYAGVLLYEVGELGGAEALFEAAARLDPGARARRPEPHRGAAAQAQPPSRPSAGRPPHSARGLGARARRVAAAARPADGLTLSLVMIVKDEEEMLPGCLAAVADAVDEMVVVDTGSTDRTVEIAESYGAKVVHFPWNGSFADARNVSLDHATGDWVLYLDADEHLVAEDAPLLRDLLGRTWREAFYLVETNYTGGEDSGSSVAHLAHAPVPASAGVPLRGPDPRAEDAGDADLPARAVRDDVDPDAPLRLPEEPDQRPREVAAQPRAAAAGGTGGAGPVRRLQPRLGVHRPGRVRSRPHAPRPRLDRSAAGSQLERQGLRADARRPARAGAARVRRPARRPGGDRRGARRLPRPHRARAPGAMCAHDEGELDEAASSPSAASSWGTRPPSTAPRSASARTSPARCSPRSAQPGPARRGRGAVPPLARGAPRLRRAGAAARLARDRPRRRSRRGVYTTRGRAAERRASARHGPLRGRPLQPRRRRSSAASSPHGRATASPASGSSRRCSPGAPTPRRRAEARLEPADSLVGADAARAELFACAAVRRRAAARRGARVRARPRRRRPRRRRSTAAGSRCSPAGRRPLAPGRGGADRVHRARGAPARRRRRRVRRAPPARGTARDRPARTPGVARPHVPAARLPRLGGRRVARRRRSRRPTPAPTSDSPRSRSPAGSRRTPGRSRPRPPPPTPEASLRPGCTRRSPPARSSSANDLARGPLKTGGRLPMTRLETGRRMDPGRQRDMVDGITPVDGTPTGTPAPGAARSGAAARPFAVTARAPASCPTCPRPRSSTRSTRAARVLHELDRKQVKVRLEHDPATNELHAHVSDATGPGEHEISHARLLNVLGGDTASLHTKGLGDDGLDQHVDRQQPAHPDVQHRRTGVRPGHEHDRPAADDDRAAPPAADHQPADAGDDPPDRPPVDPGAARRPSRARSRHARRPEHVVDRAADHLERSDPRHRHRQRRPARRVPDRGLPARARTAAHAVDEPPDGERRRPAHDPGRLELRAGVHRERRVRRLAPDDRRQRSTRPAAPRSTPPSSTRSSSSRARSPARRTRSRSRAPAAARSPPTSA